MPSVRQRERRGSSPRTLARGISSLWTPILANGLSAFGRGCARVGGRAACAKARRGVFDPFHWAHRACRSHGAGSSTLFIGRTATRSCEARGAAAPLNPLCCYGRPVALAATCSYPVYPEQMCCTLPYPLHGRRSLSNLRRPPQEDAASLNQGGGRKHGRSGATAGEPRPSETNPAPFPSGEGVTAVAVTDRGSSACSASRRAQ